MILHLGAQSDFNLPPKGQCNSFGDWKAMRQGWMPQTGLEAVVRYVWKLIRFAAECSPSAEPSTESQLLPWSQLMGVGPKSATATSGIGLLSKKY
jgi:hypothetical protein